MRVNHPLNLDKHKQPGAAQSQPKTLAGSSKEQGAGKDASEPAAGLLFLQTNKQKKA